MKGVDVSVVTVPDAVVATDVDALFDRVESFTHHAPVSEPKRTSLLHALTATGPSAVGSTGAEGPRPGRQVAAVVARRHDGRLEAVAPVVGDLRTREFSAEIAVDPDVSDPAAVIDALVGAVSDLVSARQGRILRLWVTRATTTDDRRMDAHGFGTERDLIQMRCRLPLETPVGGPGDGEAIRTRPFRPGSDDEAWLTTNNRAFETHPEQGHWDLSTFVERQQEPWFDPEGLLLLEEDGRVAGSCWTKVHADTDPPMGEIYVIGVDPDFRGRGWGRALTRAGLDFLSGRGLRVGMLYVDGDNDAAVGLYRSMGFVEDHVDRCYRRDFT